MSNKKIIHVIAALVLLFGVLVSPASTSASNHFILFTSNTGVAVTPGESIQYTVEVMNEGSSVENAQFELQGLSEDWAYQITHRGWDVRRLSVKPGESERLNLNLDVPLKVDKGAYTFRLVASDDQGIKARLPLLVEVTEQGTFRTELSSEQPNMEGHADSTFSYSAEISNKTAEEQTYSLTAQAPRGWQVDFVVDSQKVTSVTVDANGTESMTVRVQPPAQVAAGTYEIPVRATTGSTSDDLTLEVVITGKYDMELSTPSGRLSSDITAGREKNIELEVKNAGTADLEDVNLRASTPVDWEVTFDPEQIDTLKAGESTTVRATVQADKNAIAGDYAMTLSANTPEASSEAQFRMSVETSSLWGLIGILIIVGVMVLIYYLFRTYGRR